MQYLNTSLTPIQARFALWVEERMPYLLHLFDFDNVCYLPEKVESYLGTASHGETIMARFALGVWASKNTFDFDFFLAAAVLEPSQLAVVTDWMNHPFYP